MFYNLYVFLRLGNVEIDTLPFMHKYIINLLNSLSWKIYKIKCLHEYLVNLSIVSLNLQCCSVIGITKGKSFEWYLWVRDVLDGHLGSENFIN
jgi:hypothetical protein